MLITLWTASATSRQQTVTPAQQPTGSFRSRITMVPLDVRVLDRDGKPITDLRQEDFTVLEDGIPQAIRHFAIQSLTPEAAPAAGLRRNSSASEMLAAHY